MEGIILELAATVVLVTILSVFARMLKQPFILAYLAAGVLIASFGFFNLADHETFKLFSDLGIMFLLFLVGLEINYDQLKIVGKIATLLGLGQIAFTSLFGYLIAWGFGFDWLTSLYIALALTFSSTVIIVKLLSDNNELRSLHGKLSLGMLLAQDAVAILVLIILSGLGDGNTDIVINVALTLIKGVAITVIILWLGKYLLPKLFHHIAKSSELLFISSLAWVFGMAAIMNWLGFSIEMAGFLAGLSLANASEHLQISYRFRPLRDFFIVIFFVILGASAAFGDFSGLGWPILAFSAFVLIGNPLIVLILAGLMGYKKRTSLLAGLTMAQVSEFSLIMAAIGLKLGHIDAKVVTLITAVAIITITISSYLIIKSESIYNLFKKPLSIFERKDANETKDKNIRKRRFVLIGCHRTGLGIAAHLPKNQLLIVEFDPDVVHHLKNAGYHVLFGDITDPEILAHAHIKKAEAIIVTSPDLQDNLMIVESFRKNEKKPLIIVRASRTGEMQILYDAGADYVLLPHLTAGQILGHVLASKDIEKGIHQMRKKEMEVIQL